LVDILRRKDVGTKDVGTKDVENKDVENRVKRAKWYS
jgi:hypothetical protein